MPVKSFLKPTYLGDQIFGIKLHFSFNQTINCNHPRIGNQLLRAFTDIL